MKSYTEFKRDKLTNEIAVSMVNLGIDPIELCGDILESICNCKTEDELLFETGGFSNLVSKAGSAIRNNFAPMMQQAGQGMKKGLQWAGQQYAQGANIGQIQQATKSVQQLKQSMDKMGLSQAEGMGNAFDIIQKSLAQALQAAQEKNNPQAQPQAQPQPGGSSNTVNPQLGGTPAMYGSGTNFA